MVSYVWRRQIFCKSSKRKIKKKSSLTASKCRCIANCFVPPSSPKWGLTGLNFRRMKALPNSLETPANCTLLKFYKYCFYLAKKYINNENATSENRVHASWCEGCPAQTHLHLCSHTISGPLSVCVRESECVLWFLCQLQVNWGSQKFPSIRHLSD